LGGGHIAEFQFDHPELPDINPLWIPPWKTIEPDHYRPALHARRYGAPPAGKLLSGLAGHTLCLDYFGVPSADEAKFGLSILGEAPNSRWQVTSVRRAGREAVLTLSVPLPAAGLVFTREITLCRNETIAYFKETVTNLRKADHYFHWVQHVTLGVPFVSEGKSYVVLAAKECMTYPRPYDAHPLLPASRKFTWPHAPTISGGSVDLAHPFTYPGTGFLVTALLHKGRKHQFVAAVNTGLNMMLAYCFKTADFPWVAVWEENKARSERPWNQRCQARALEFGSTPFPLPREEVFRAGSLFDTPAFTSVSARARKTVQYIAVLAKLPQRFGRLLNIETAHKEIILVGTGAGSPVRLPASRLHR
jgi:hypothetical protein